MAAAAAGDKAFLRAEKTAKEEAETAHPVSFRQPFAGLKLVNFLQRLDARRRNTADPRNFKRRLAYGLRGRRSPRAKAEPAYSNWVGLWRPTA